MIDLHPTVCNICGGKVVWISNDIIYGKLYGSGHMYFCTKCHAYVGTHNNRPRKAKGILANKEMRKWKVRCHKLFDSMWYNSKQRDYLYNKLADELNISVYDCHFGYFDIPMLQKSYDILKKWRCKPNVFN